MDLKTVIRNVPDFPRPGVQFKDMTTLWGNSYAFRESIDILYQRYKDKGINKVVAAESRGFVVGGPLAYLLRTGFVPVRKKGKLPYRQVEVTYQLEYGTDTLTMHQDALKQGDTGGTLKAMIELVRILKGDIIEAAFVVELEFLEGRKDVDIPVYSIVKFAGEED